MFGATGNCDCGERCDCAARPRCCVNEREGVAYFFVGSHWAPRLPLSWVSTVEHMQRSRFCLCPGGDTPYTKRFFLALLTGCVPVVFKFEAHAHLASVAAAGAAGRVTAAATRRTRTAHVTYAGSSSWWKDGGPPNDAALPFSGRIPYHDLVVEIPSGQLKGFVNVLRRVPHHVVEEKQRRIEAVRHLLLYDPSGAREDAFTMVIRDLIERLA